MVWRWERECACVRECEDVCVCMCWAGDREWLDKAHLVQGV